MPAKAILGVSSTISDKIAFEYGYVESTTLGESLFINFLNFSV